MKRFIQFLGLSFSIFLFNSVGYTGPIYDPKKISFDPMEITSDLGVREKDRIEINPEYSITESLDQKSTHTCFAHAAYYLLQYFHNSTGGLGQKLSLIDILGKTQEGKINRGGRSWLLLEQLRKDYQVALAPTVDVEDFARFDDRFGNLTPLTSSKLRACQSSLKNILKDSEIAYRGDLKSLIQSECQADKPHSTYRIFNQVLHPEIVTLAPYTVLLSEKDKLLEMTPDAEKPELIQKQVREFLMPFEANSTSYPVILSFCSRWEGNKCLGNHALTIAGASQVCAGSSGAEKCATRWKIVNSWGGSKQGWLAAAPFIRSILQFPGSYRLTSIRPCKEDCKDLPRVHHSKKDSFLRAVVDRDLDAIQKFIKEGAPLDEQDGEGWTPLFTLVYQEITDPRDHKKMSQAVKALLKAGANPNIPDNKGSTPLSLAAYRGHKMVVRWLIEAGADLELKNQEGWTPLFGASYRGHVGIVKALLKAGANPHHPDIHGKTPLDWAREKGNVSLIRILEDPKRQGSLVRLSAR